MTTSTSGTCDYSSVVMPSRNVWSAPKLTAYRGGVGVDLDGEDWCESGIH